MIEFIRGIPESVEYLLAAGMVTGYPVGETVIVMSSISVYVTAYYAAYYSLEGWDWLMRRLEYR